jgi:hypothetical protein
MFGFINQNNKGDIKHCVYWIVCMFVVMHDIQYEFYILCIHSDLIRNKFHQVAVRIIAYERLAEHFGGIVVIVY